MHIQTSDQEALSLGIGGYSCNWGPHICGLYETEKERDWEREKARLVRTKA